MSNIKNTLRALVIEDDPIALRVIQQMLMKNNFVVDVAIDSEQALELCQNDYCLIFTDCGLPDMDGFELSKKIRHIEEQNNIPRRPLIMLSAYSMDKDVQQKCEFSSIDEYFIKPLHPNELQIILHRWVSVFGK